MLHTTRELHATRMHCARRMLRKRPAVRMRRMREPRRHAGDVAALQLVRTPALSGHGIEEHCRAYYNQGNEVSTTIAGDFVRKERMTTAPVHLSPTPSRERIVTLDILRGFALFGILVVNMELFTHSMYDYTVGAIADLPPLDRVVRLFVAFFFEGKFYSIFSFLFGAGMALMMQRSAEKGVAFVPIYTRRMLALLAIGLIHAYFIWVGDILIAYSVIGFLVLIFFRNRRPRTLLIWAVIGLGLPILINLGLWGLVGVGRAAVGEEAMAQQMAGQVANYLAQDAQADAAYATGSFLEVTRQRVMDMRFVFSTWPFLIFNVLAAYLAGLAAGKAGLFANLAQRRDFLRRALNWGLVIGLIGNALYVVCGYYSLRVSPSLLSWLSTTGQTFGAPALAAAYMAGIALLALDGGRRARMRPLADAGRMALTNYLAQSIICTLLFYGYGFGLYGIGQAAGFLVAIAIYSLQLLWSGWWLKRFLFGPFEWLWRVITYWSVQPMRRVVAPIVQTATST